MAQLGCTLLRHNNNDTFMFRVGATPDPKLVAESYAKGAVKTKTLVEAELRPTLRRLWQFMKYWRPTTG